MRHTFCVAFTPSEWRRLRAYATDVAQTAAIAVATYPEEEDVPREELRTRKLTFDLHATLAAKVRRLAKHCNGSCSAVIRTALERLLEQEEADDER